MNETISLAHAVTPQPAVHDVASPAYRFLHRQVCRVKAVFAQKGRPRLFAPLENWLTAPKPQPVAEEYVGRHRQEPGQELETRVIAADGTDTGQRYYWTPEPTFREKIAQARAQRAARRSRAAVWAHTDAFPVLEDTGWILRTRQAQRFDIYAKAMQP